MLKTTLSLALILTLFTAHLASGQDFFVDATGDSTDCTIPGPTACSSIQDAVDLGGGQGANVTIAPGNYFSLEPVNLGGSGVSLLGGGAGPGEVVIQSPNGAVSIGGPGSFFLHNLTMDGNGDQNVIALNDARDVIISDCVLQDGSAGLDLNNSTGVQLVGAIVMATNATGIVLRSFSTLIYNGGAGSLVITGPGTGIGIAIDVGGKVGIFGDFDIGDYGVGVRAFNGATVDLAPQTGSRIHDNAFGGIFIGTQVRLGGPLVIDGNGVGIDVLQGGSLILVGTSVRGNAGVGVQIRNNSSGRFFGPTVENNGGDGVAVSTLSSLRIEGPVPFGITSIFGNTGAQVVCRNTSKLEGDTSGIEGVIDCDKPSKK